MAVTIGRAARRLLKRILRCFLVLFLMVFASLFTCASIFGIFSICLFAYAFVVCLGLAVVSCILERPSARIYIVVVCAILFLGSSFTFFTQVACTSKLTESCLSFYLEWRGGDNPRTLNDVLNANVMLLCCTSAIFVFSGMMLAFSVQLKLVGTSDINPNDVEDTPKVEYKCTIPAVEMASVNNSFGTQECIICQDNFDVNKDVVVLPCKHIFHHNCLNHWVNRTQACPICREKITNVQVISSQQQVEDTEGVANNRHLPVAS